jgi:hypothetical protein
MNTYVCLQEYRAKFFLEWEMFEANVVEKIRTYTFCSKIFSGNHVVYEIMWKNVVAQDRSQVEI